MRRRPKIPANRQHLSASAPARRASSCVARMARGGARRRMRRRCRHLSTSVNMPRTFEGRAHLPARKAKNRKTPWLRLAFLGFAWLFREPSLAFRRTSVGFCWLSGWLSLAFRIAGARRIALRRDRAPPSLSKGRRATPPPAAACQRSRFTCPNNRARRANARPGREAQNGPSISYRTIQEHCQVYPGRERQKKLTSDDEKRAAHPYHVRSARTTRPESPVIQLPW